MHRKIKEYLKKIQKNDLDFQSIELEYLNLCDYDLAPLLSELDKNPASAQRIHYLNLAGNLLQIINLSMFTGLRSANLSDNYLEEVNLADLGLLEELWLQDNKLRSFTADLPALKVLCLKDNALTQISLQRLSSLTALELDNTTCFSKSNYKKKPGLNQCNKLLTLDIPNNSLEFLSAEGIGLQSIDLSRAGKLKHLNLSMNFISELNVENLTKLVFLNVSFNQIKMLDVAMLGMLECFYATSYDHGEMNCNLPLASADTIKKLKINVTVKMLDLSIFKQLTYACLSGKNLQFIDCSLAHNLKLLALFNTSVQSIDLTALSNLEAIHMDKNPLITLDFLDLPALYTVSLDISGASLATRFALHQLTLDLPSSYRSFNLYDHDRLLPQVAFSCEILLAHFTSLLAAPNTLRISNYLAKIAADMFYSKTCALGSMPKDLIPKIILSLDGDVNFLNIFNKLLTPNSVEHKIFEDFLKSDIGRQVLGSLQVKRTNAILRYLDCLKQHQANLALVQQQKGLLFSEHALGQGASRNWRLNHQLDCWDLLPVFLPTNKLN